MRIERFVWSALFFVVLMSACDRSSQPDRVIARVGDEELLLDDVLADIPEHVRSNLSASEIREIVLLWINEQVLYQEALGRELDKRPELEKEFVSLKRDLLVNKLLELTLDNDMSISEEEIQAYYDANQEGFVLTEQMVHAYHLLLPTQKDANDVRRRLRSGETFDSIAMSLSSDSLLTTEWDLGYFTASDVIPQMANVVFKMAVNSISLPIKSDFGYHVVKVVDKRKQGDVKSLDIVRDEIRQKLATKRRQEKYQRFLLQMKSKFKIQTNFQLLDSSRIDSLLFAGD